MASLSSKFYNITLPFSIALLLTLPCSNSLYFNKTRFDADATDILYQGDAVLSLGAVELIYMRTYSCRVGWATYAQRVPIWDSNSGKLTDFTTHFSFIIDTQNNTLYGSGIAFFLAPVGYQILPNSAGGFLGLFNTSTIDSSRNQIVMVEFDSTKDDNWDPADVIDHVGINNNSLSSAAYTRWNASYHSGDTADVWITYDASTKNLSLWWTYQTTNNPKENTSLSHVIDLSKVLSEWVTVGISGATGTQRERATLLSWEFSSSLDVKEINGEEQKNVAALASGIVSGCVVIGGAVLAFLICRRKKRRSREADEKMNLTSINEDLERGSGPRKFSYHELVSATNNFSVDRKLGEGGFGAVYKGYLNESDMMVAVKRISRNSKQGKKQYVAEVKTIGQLRHRNLVQLVGWCHDKGEFLLVYEFMPKGSLDAHLFGRNSPLNWAVRYRISLGLASALLYLHEEWEQCVVHRDVKSSNVMLDSGFGVKLGDFGLARLMDHELGPQTTGLAGTFGYMAPEYVCTGRASKESDVYSYGVVALEIATGRKANKTIHDHESEMSLVEWVWSLYGSGNLLSAIDKRPNTDFDERQAETLMVVGLWCAHPDCNLRPPIRQVIHVLNFETAVPNLPAKMPVPTYLAPIPPPVCSGDPSATVSSLDIGR